MKVRARRARYPMPSSPPPALPLELPLRLLLGLLPWTLASATVCAAEVASVVSNDVPSVVSVEAPTEVTDHPPIAAEPGPWRMVWRAQLGSQRSDYAQDSPQAAALLPAAASHAQLEFANIELDARVRLPGERSASAQAVVQQSKDATGTQTQAHLLTCATELMAQGAAQSLSVGKLRWNQGQNLAFHPIDIVGRHNEPKSTVGRRQDDLLAKEGDGGVRFQQLGETLSYEALAVDARHDVMWAARAGVQQRLSGRWGRTDWSLAHSARSNRVWTLGATSSTPTGEDTSLYLEALLANARQLPAALPDTLTGPSLAAASAGRVQTGQLWPHALLAIQRVTAVGQLEGAYYYNGSGLSGTQWRSAMSQVSLASPDRGMARLPYLPVAASLANASTDYYLRRRYVSARYDSLSLTDGYNVEVQLLAGLDAPSGASFYTALNYQLMTRTTLKLSYFVQGGGRASEFGMGPVRAQLAVRITIEL